jgi:polyferredoxin
MSVLKYALLVVVLWLTWRAGELIFRGFDPCYALIGRHGEDITYWAYIVSGAIVAVSLIVMLPFCRWFCPLAAVLNPFSRFGLTRVRRHEEVCNDCAACAKKCPMAIPVDRLALVDVARCTSCFSCIDACPQAGAMSWGPSRRWGLQWTQAALIALVLACLTGATTASYVFPIPSYVRTRGTPPEQVAVVELRIEGVRCRGRGNLLLYFLERDDLYEIPGYFKVEAWPDPEIADVRLTYDPARADATTIKLAITEPYFDEVADYWRTSPFSIEGYDPLAVGAGP